MMMGLGQFVFSLSTLAYQELQRATQWRHPAQARIGARAARQYLGPGDDTITLSGLLLPELAGTPASLDQLREMGGTGDAWPLVDGAGRVYGSFVIESMNETRGNFMADGRSRRIAFQLVLQRVDDQGGASQFEAIQ